MENNCLWTWWPPKKKKVNTWFSMVWTVLLQIFSPLEIKDNSNFNKGQGRAVQVKDCPLK